MKRNGLTVKFVANVKPAATVKRYSDGGGLLLVVQPTGGKSWIQRLVVDGKRRDLGLGSVEFVTLAEARDRAYENRRAARTGSTMPSAVRRRTVPTFADGLEAVIAVHSPTWKDRDDLERRWRQTLDAHAAGFMDRPIDTLTTGDVLGVLSPVWTTKRATATRVRQRLSTIFQWAVAKGYRADNPAGDAIGAALPKGGAKTSHHEAVPHAEVREVLDAIRQSAGWRGAKLALEFLILTGARSGEVRGAKWEEIDGDVWTIPADRAKTGRDHRVPLSGPARAILETAKAIRGTSGYVFPATRGGLMADTTLGRLVRSAGVAAKVHGFRSTFRDWCGESGVDREVAEAALAHVVRGVEGAYARSDLLDRRRPIMDRWAAYVTGEKLGKVVKLRAG